LKDDSLKDLLFFSPSPLGSERDGKMVKTETKMFVDMGNQLVGFEEAIEIMPI